jgi:Polyketide cyclase / dehydrase and lipid transport
MSSSDNWPPSEGLNTIIVPREDAVMTTVARAAIHAPASAVFDAVRNVAEYEAWNTFVPRVVVHSQPAGTSEDSQMLETGTSFTFHVIMDSSKPNKDTPTQLRCTDVSTPDKPSSYVPANIIDRDATFTRDLSRVYRISWTTEGGFVARGLRTERFHEIISLGENECEVRTWENQGSFLARTVKWMFEKTLKQKFQNWCDDLKKFCEEKARAP